MYKITLNLVKKSKKELFFKVITSFLLRGLLLIIPIYWSKVINNLANNIYIKSYYLISFIIILAIIYYIFQYLNQLTWFKFYDKLYIEYTKLIVNDNKINNLTLAEYTNIINNDIDIICTFLGNLIVRIFQVLEFIFIYIYFLSININIFLITIFISIIMVFIFIKSGNKLQLANDKRKSSLDYKTSTTHKMYTLVKNKKNLSLLNKTFLSNSKNYLKNNRIFNLLSSKYTYLVLGIMEVSKYLVIIYSIYLIKIGYMEIGTILLIYNYYDKIITNFEVIGTISTEYQSFVVSLNRLNKVGS